MNLKYTTGLFSCLIALALFGGIAHFTHAGGASTGIDWIGSPYDDASLDYTPTTTVSGNATWSTNVSGYLAYAWNRWTLASKFPSCFTGQAGNFSSDTMNSTCVSGFVSAGSNIQVTINQEARVYDGTTGTEITSGATLPPGKTIRLEFKKLVPEDIQWFGTGYSLDSPYGDWSANAAPPPRVNSTNGGVSANHVTCDAQDYANSINIQDESKHEGCLYQLQQYAGNTCRISGTDGSGNTVCTEYWYCTSAGCTPPSYITKAQADTTCNSNGYTAGTVYTFDVYAPLEVNPPTRTLSAGGLTCVSAAADADSDLAWTCTVPNTPGATLTPEFDYSSTYGYFYYRYHDYRNMNYTSSPAPNNLNYGGNGCYGNNIPLYQVLTNVSSAPGFNPVSRQGLRIGDVASTPYKLNVPAMNVPYSFTVTPNTVPATPTASCPASLLTGATGTFSFSGATDADGDTIRYGIDWVGTGPVTQWVPPGPSPAYLPSGTASGNVTHAAPGSTGPWTVRVLAEDSRGGQSGWKSCTVNVTTAPPDLAAAAVAPTTATAGTAKSFTSKVTNSGTGATGAAFTDRFQWATDSLGTGAANMGTYSSAALAAGANNTATVSYTFASAGTFYMRACADQNSSGVGSITESSEANNCSTWTAVTVSAPLQPDLTAGAVTPTTATAGVSKTFSATVSNTGTGSTGATFTDRFQWATDSLGTGATNLGTYASAIITAGNTNTASAAYTFPSAATYYVRACADQDASGTGSVTESNEGNNCGSWTAIVVSPPPQPDLTAQNVSTSPSSPTTGSPTTLSALVSNGPAAATGAGFTDLFEIDNDSNHTALVDVFATIATSSTALAANGSKVMYASYTFPTTGIWYLRLCADMNTSGAGSITESDETNNCSTGSWVTVTVGSPTPAGLSCTPSPASGDTTTTYTFTVAKTGSWPAGSPSYTWTDPNAATHSSFGPSTATTYSATYAAAGNYAPTVSGTLGGTTVNNVSCSPITVGTVCGGNPSPSITADAPRVIGGDTDQLDWSATGVVTSCTISGPGLNQTVPASSCNIAGGSANPQINTQSTYCIVCDGNQVTKQCVTIDVVPKIIED